ncbi:hypothetical protein PVL29_021736 [Vitis rotundifolia]|uniref:Uncharacterized protein n=1 Tax=Vitis rotundifolia TaxID=103349 RepID=A0AA38Z060_VITRO|nr:hypothetical protein PVL29_021736 [Vitis rotundifolia]
MMTSMISAFDALSFEPFCQKLKLSLVPSHREKTAPKEAMAIKKEEKERSKSLPQPPPPQQQRRPEEKRSRFAPELDGLHCFETIVRY